ncbi:Copia protein, partial [Mucuna pruriens]
MSIPMHLTSILSLTKQIKRLDIMFSICFYAQFQYDLRESHLTFVKCIFRYLKITNNLGLCYKKSNQYRLKGYSDVDFSKNRIKRKSTNGGCHFIGANLARYYSTLHSIIRVYLSCITLLTTSVDQDYDILESNIPFICDNTIAISLSKNPILHSRAKHIEIKHHFTRDYLVDIFTKPLPEDKLIHIKNLI